MSPEAFLVITRALPEPMALVDGDGLVVAANPACRDFPHVSIVPAVSLAALVDAPDRLRAYLAICRASRSIVKETLTIVAPDGRRISVRCEGVGLGQAAEGEGHAVLLRLRSRESAAREVALHAAEARYRAMVDNAVHGICRCSTDGTVLDANPALAQLLGAAALDDLVGLSLPDDIYDDPVAFLTLIDRVRHAGRVLSVDANWRRVDGTPVAVRVSGRFESPDSSTDALELIVEDATERRTLEAQLAQATKMESVGRLAGGIAHDFNNLLTAILGYVDLMQGTLPVGDPIGRHAQQIRKAAERASALTRQLLAFSRKQILQPRVLDLNSVVEDSTQMLQRLIAESIELVTHLEPALLRVRVDPSQVQQVLLNLAVNARDAMPRGGTLTIETQNVTLPAGSLGRSPEVEPGPYVSLKVGDTGEGMDAATRARIFEPFFTTKRIGDGTGLGLSTVYGVVRQSGGHIIVESEPGRGTCFTMFLPAFTQLAHTPPASQIATDGPVGSETLLLVEDDAMVRTLSIEALRLKGYRVLEAVDGREALALAQQHRHAIDLLITDVVMPRMTGRELSDRLTADNPRMRVLYLSGYSGILMNQHGMLDRGIDLLEKPFTPSMLVTRVRRALDRAPTTRPPRLSPNPS